MQPNEELLKEVRMKAQGWLGEQYDAETRAAVQAMLDNEDATELVDSFYKDLEFGTGGLRGIMGAGSNRMNRYTVGAATQGLSNYLKREFAGLDEIKVVIGYDCRNNSPQFADIAAHIFAANGIHVYLFDKLRPTPEISYAIRTLGCQSGVMITASHNPKVYNGYKAYWSDGAQIIAPHDRNIIIEVNKIHQVSDIKFDGDDKFIHMLGEEMDARFIESVKGLSLSPEAIRNHHDIGIVYTPIHGTGVVMVPRALRAIGFSNIINVPEQDVVSGNFPTVDSPNPENPEAMTLALRRAQETGAQLVLASDPDGDRLGVGLRNDRDEITLINGNEICMLMTYYSIMRRKELGDLRANDYVVKTIVTTELIREIADRNHVTLHDCYTGFKWIADVIRQNESKNRYIGGGEESYGFLWEDFIRDKSSVSACCMFAEMNAWALDKGITLYEMLRQIYREYGVYGEKGISVVRTGKSGADEIEAMMKNYRNNPMQTINGSKVIERKDFAKLEGYDLTSGDVFTLNMPTTSNVLQFFTEDGTKLSIRPSGTEPKIKYYIGVRQEVSNSDVAEARRRCDEKMARICKELNL